ncbi:MAG TPA: thioredoxin-disulfide reductase [Bacteroidales bacterium]|jgi:thioredoxin reductase (NADPH)|nr:thioredoxin-disulfide reductase [Bacteroidales bacterium]
MYQYDAIIIGAGPAGLTAGIYLGRSKVKTLLLSDGMAGGQMNLTHEIANYPGIEKISGYQLASVMKKQAQNFGCEIKTNIKIEALELSSDSKKITLNDGTVFSSKAVILAPGGRSRTLGIPGENAFKGRGVSYCATCDGDFFTGKEIVVVGGGNSALEESISLTKYVSKLTIVHQFDYFQAFPHIVEEAKQNPKINFVLNSTLSEIYGNEQLEGVKIKNLISNEEQAFSTNGVFIFVGYEPNTDFLKGHVQLNERNEILVNNDMQTNIKGVYAAGDCIEKRYRQITTAVGEATVAAMAVSEFIHQKK